MTPSPAYRDGWIANANGRSELDTPYDPERQTVSYRDWLQGLRDRAAKLPGDPYLEILDADAMRG